MVVEMDALGRSCRMFTLDRLRTERICAMMNVPHIILDETVNKTTNLVWTFGQNRDERSPQTGIEEEKLLGRKVKTDVYKRQI